MNVVELLNKRRAVRAYSDKDVPKELIREIFAQAQQSASNCNTQPWHVSIISGDTKNQLATDLVAEVSSGKAPSPTFQPGDYGLADEYKVRQVDCAVALYKAVGVERGDKPARMELMLKNWQFFGAPHVAIFSMPKAMKEVNAVDVGIYLQAIMLLMVENGLASCPQGALAFYPDPILEVAQIPEENGILFGLSFGYEDQEAQINTAKTDRAALDDIAVFVG
jgi:nitroreductase